MAKLRQLPTGVNTPSRTVVPTATGVVYAPSTPQISFGDADSHPLNHAAKHSERTNARAERVARSRGLSEAQPSVTGPLTGKHLEDAKTDAKPTKIRILQMLFIWTTGNRGLRPTGYTPGYAPQLRFGFASFRSPCGLSQSAKTAAQRRRG